MQEISSQKLCEQKRNACSDDCTDHCVQKCCPEAEQIARCHLEYLARNDADDDLHDLKDNIDQNRLAFVLIQERDDRFDVLKAFQPVQLEEIQLQWYTNHDQQQERDLYSRKDHLAGVLLLADFEILRACVQALFGLRRF